MIKLGIIMDPISSIKIKKDTSFSIMLEAQKRNYFLYYIEMKDIYYEVGEVYANSYLISVKYDEKKWYSFKKKYTINLKELDVILMRKDPPFDIEFLYITYILEHIENFGVLIINKPKSLRDYNEKISTLSFKYSPKTLISCSKKAIYSFQEKFGDIILKPINKMGGDSVFYVKKNDPNVSVIIDQLTNYGNSFCLIQEYIKEILNGDRRIIMINGSPLPYCLVRIPNDKEIRGNLAAGASFDILPLRKIDYEISNNISSFLKDKGLIFVGLDIIGNYLTEINITSPTGINEIESVYKVSISGILLDSIEKLLNIKH
uniref:Glutathione synthetase n=1 Tax=Wigglesworthia glossinidia brevipalpis TaxID=36870 RepID=GSHB_WIGBR|nr:RecName: Full=Glutathione synthetase; AltName: Full=GSH synthetase; Short=GSH-S; Short=GSHase; AltName: Full=Glutathione synthase [Wigglesworthia glossinidia endosymbiont of Glossina brevipalpis]